MRKNSQDPRACDSDRASGLAHDVSAHTSQRYSPVHPSVVILALNKKAAWSKTSKHVNVRPSLRSQLHDEPPMPRACPLFLAGDDTPTTSDLTVFREMRRDAVLNGHRRVETRCADWAWAHASTGMKHGAYRLGTLQRQGQAHRIRR
ncbi:hypothetical protein PCH_Pc18g06340 [Penicillium rubens Wisconsin 54-1255]|uniref:Uncharacterized protein n=1 Tax=Penicillium rubens (strain ATCC 28089 / DSM 1075 / NRRL 1951 / Wisconsin 54-1255) TaxID=500485 RepID=B6HCN0_PENRW|nr:hypothetical protein PCH_Pc18g06340 [Penicillium rubens Wisconsin 54-1255]